MAKAIDVLLAAEEDSKGALKNGSYNTDHMLTSEQIKSAALVRMGFNVGEDDEDIADKLHVFPVSAHERVSFDNNIQLQEALTACKQGESAAFNIAGHQHHVAVKLVPEATDPLKVSVHYYNPTILKALTKAERGVKIAAQVAELRELNKKPVLADGKKVDQMTDEEMQLIATQAVDEELKKNQDHSNLGREFAKQLLAHLKTKGLSSQDAEVVDDSKDHQHNNCCGLAVADYIAGTEPQAGMSSEKREAYYKDMGQKTFEAIAKAKELEAAIKASLQESQKIAVKQVEHDSDWVFVDSAATVKSEMEAAEIAAAVAQIDAVYVAQADSSTHTIATNLLESANIKGDVTKDTALKALRNSGLLEEKDLQQITKELDQHMKSPPTTYSAKDLVALMQKTSFVRGQASAYGQFSPTSTPTVGGSRAPSQGQGRQ